MTVRDDDPFKRAFELSKQSETESQSRAAAPSPRSRGHVYSFSKQLESELLPKTTFWTWGKEKVLRLIARIQFQATGFWDKGLTDQKKIQAFRVKMETELGQIEGHSDKATEKRESIRRQYARILAVSGITAKTAEAALRSFYSATEQSQVPEQSVGTATPSLSPKHPQFVVPPPYVPSPPTEQRKEAEKPVVEQQTTAFQTVSAPPSYESVMANQEIANVLMRVDMIEAGIRSKKTSPDDLKMMIEDLRGRMSWLNQLLFTHQLNSERGELVSALNEKLGVIKTPPGTEALSRLISDELAIISPHAFDPAEHQFQDFLTSLGLKVTSVQVTLKDGQPAGYVVQWADPSQYNKLLHAKPQAAKEVYRAKGHGEDPCWSYFPIRNLSKIAYQETSAVFAAPAGASAPPPATDGYVHGIECVLRERVKDQLQGKVVIVTPQLPNGYKITFVDGKPPEITQQEGGRFYLQAFKTKRGGDPKSSFIKREDVPRILNPWIEQCYGTSPKSAEVAQGRVAKPGEINPDLDQLNGDTIKEKLTLAGLSGFSVIPWMVSGQLAGYKVLFQKGVTVNKMIDGVLPFPGDKKSSFIPLPYFNCYMRDGFGKYTTGV